MKKVLVAVALVMGLGSSVAFAQNAENANAVVATAQAPQDEYTKIEVKDLPAAVTETLGKTYPESTIKEAYHYSLFASYHLLTDLPLSGNE